MEQSVIRVLLIADRGVWVAQCIDFDLAAQGETVREALQTFVRLFEVQIETDQKAGRDPFAASRPAPRWYADRYNEASARIDSKPAIPPPYMLESRLSENPPDCA